MGREVFVYQFEVGFALRGIVQPQSCWLGAVGSEVVPWKRSSLFRSANRALWSLSGLSLKLRIPLLQRDDWRRVVPKRKSM